MAETIGKRIKRAWNAFMNRDPPGYNYGEGYPNRPDRPRVTRGNERTILNAILNKIAMDCAAITIEHVVVDENGKYLETVDSGLNRCLNLEANKDQNARAFKQDVFLSMLDKGAIAVVPTEIEDNRKTGRKDDIKALRVGKIVEWYPDHVRIDLYNDRIGRHQEIVLPKKKVAILENPLYPVMNEPNSTLQRLIRVLRHLDQFDEQTSSGKLDMVIQLPYTVKSPARKADAEKRRTDIEMQLTGSKYGIAYIDGTEKITQLNRPIENTYMAQIEYLMKLMYSQLGITQEIMDGSAEDRTMQNYYSRTVEPIVSVFVDEDRRKYLTDEDRDEGETILYFRDPFKIMPITQFADIADKMSRNEIMTANELRQRVGLKPSDDPGADKLLNKNINHPESGMEEGYEDYEEVPEE